MGGPNPQETEKQQMESADRLEDLISVLNVCKKKFRTYKEELRKV
jgi:hypothetical protein